MLWKSGFQQCCLEKTCSGISIGILETVYFSVAALKKLITITILKSMTGRKVFRVARLLACFISSGALLITRGYFPQGCHQGQVSAFRNHLGGLSLQARQLSPCFPTLLLEEC